VKERAATVAGGGNSTIGRIRSRLEGLYHDRDIAPEL
jgi:hypothetical protein